MTDPPQWWGASPTTVQENGAYSDFSPPPVRTSPTPPPIGPSSMGSPYEQYTTIGIVRPQPEFMSPTRRSSLGCSGPPKRGSRTSHSLPSSDEFMRSPAPTSPSTSASHYPGSPPTKRPGSKIGGGAFGRGTGGRMMRAPPQEPSPRSPSPPSSPQTLKGPNGFHSAAGPGSSKWPK